MAQITYDVILTIDGIGTLSVGEQLDFLSLNTGSSDGMDVAQPSQILMEFLIDPNDQTIPFWLGRQIQVKIDPSDGTATDVFYGWIDSANVTGQDTLGQWAVISLAASGPMSRIGQVNITGTGFGWTSVSERTRINGGVANSLDSMQWQNFPNAVAWNEINPTQFWFNFGDLVSQSRVLFNPNTPAGMTLESYTAGVTDVLSYLQALARGTQAILWDDPTTNNVNYTAFDYWSTIAAVNLDVSTCVLADSLTANTDISNIYNTIEWQNSSTSVWRTDINSINTHGQRPVNVESELANTNDLATMATNRLVALSQPKTTLSNITIDLDLLPAATRAEMYFTGLPNFWNLQNVPPLFGDSQIYYQAGTSLTMNHYHAEVSMIVVSDAMRRGLTTWNQVSSANLWNNYLTSTTTWQQVS